ncbi:WD40/YVTN repeat domain containing superfamily protein [Babesia gibsoni]|uniref:WD40/YVTN repeat domain containing superfamily protein n=1 Tax=Babesia gibsoni TaxID=33632 RepID=A0AAD8URW2_BABGI|nr:WD40/YVTN repeat domain containing superfamily protein [Babesia gibsoni]
MLDEGDNDILVDDSVEKTDEDMEDEDDILLDKKKKGNNIVWTKDIRPLKEGEVLEVAPGCYDMLHKISVDWPCLSFDIFYDDLGACRVKFPHTCYVIAGTQPDIHSKKEAAIHVMKWSNLSSNEGMDEYDEDSDDGDSGCVLKCSSMRHPGIVNRIRLCPQANRLVCTMADNGNVHIWDVKQHLSRLEAEGNEHHMERGKPVYTCDSHDVEGYAVGWSNLTTGALATGDCSGVIVYWNPIEGGWKDSRFFKTSSSVEDIQWSVTEEHIFASACCDGYMRIHDSRSPTEVVNSMKVCDGPVSDVNTIAWNKCQTTLLAAGDETGAATIFDLRYPDLHVAKLLWHKDAITSISWHPTDSAVCIASSRDDSISVWDLSVENETVEGDELTEQNIPQQMLFLHMGQNEITEVMFHPQISGMAISTSVDGFNVFKCVNID